MKKLLYLFIILSIVVFSCKKESNSDNNSTKNLEEKLTTNLNALRDAVVVYNDELQQSGDSLAAFNSMRTWLANSPDVSGGWFHNIEFLEIEFSNGLKSPINIIPVSNNGEHLRRGGGAAGNLTAFHFNAAETQKIKNKKVLVLIPYPDEFGYSTADIQNLKTTIESGQADMEADIEVGSNVDFQDLNRLDDYGLIIIDVHGIKYGFFLSYLDEDYDITDVWFPEDVIADAFNVHSIPADKIANGQIEIGLQINTYSDGEVNFRFNVLITEDCIRQLEVDLSDAVVFGNHCYSGHTADGPSNNNMPEAWRSRNAATYYGYAGVNDYSAPVDNDFCKDMELALISGLITDGDTTGEAHLKQDGSEYFYVPSYGYNRAMLATLGPDTTPPTPTPIWPLYFRQYFDKDYEYESCGDDLIDVRDGAVYKTVCIGDQVWMAENLRYDTLTNWCLNNDPTKCDDSVGRFYDWQTAVVACPQGWHLPSTAEWQALADTLGGWQVAGGKMKSTTGFWNAPNTGASNSSGFNALGSGILITTSSDFSAIGFQEWHWTSDEGIPGKAYCTFLSYDSEMFSLGGKREKSGGLLCRCVKDK